MCLGGECYHVQTGDNCIGKGAKESSSSTNIVRKPQSPSSQEDSAHRLKTATGGKKGKDSAIAVCNPYMYVSNPASHPMCACAIESAVLKKPSPSSDQCCTDTSRDQEMSSQKRAKMDFSDSTGNDDMPTCAPSVSLPLNRAGLDCPLITDAGPDRPQAMQEEENTHGVADEVTIVTHMSFTYLVDSNTGNLVSVHKVGWK